MKEKVRNPMNKTFSGLLGTIVLAGALAGCTSSGGDSGQAAPEKTMTTQPATTEKPTASNPGKGIIGSTTMTSCDKTAGTVVAKGTATMPADTQGEVQISVSWVDPATSAVLVKGTEILKDAVPLKPKDWSISAKLETPPADVSCVLGATVLPPS
ncbi:type IV pilus biogenesis protein CpaD/CtpE [Arthrobacter sp. GAS37]